MKRILSNVILFILTIIFFLCIYISVFKFSIALICVLLLFFALYGLCMNLGWKSMEKLKKYEQKLIHFRSTPKDDIKILLFSLTTLSPMYFCVVLASLIPIFTYEVRFITVFPCVLLNCLPAASVLDEYYVLTHKKLPFLVCFLVFTIVFCFMGETISSIVLKKFIV